MKNLWIILIFSLLLSCSTSMEAVPGTASSSYSHFITSFFDRYIEDLERAGSVVRKRELIKNLSHLQKMNAGGKRYYLLERESITELLQSITIEKYDDIILTGRGGRVLYSMHDDSLFNTVISRDDDGSPLNQCYKNGIKGNIYIHPPSEYPGLSSPVSLFIAYPVIIDRDTSGLLIAVIDTALLVSEKPKRVIVLNYSGRIAVTKSINELGKSVISEKHLVDLEANGSPVSIKYEKKLYELQPFNYLNIHWLVTERN